MCYECSSWYPVGLVSAFDVVLTTRCVLICAHDHKQYTPVGMAAVMGVFNTFMWYAGTSVCVCVCECVCCQALAPIFVLYCIRLAM